jgi:hypothetical protein
MRQFFQLIVLVMLSFLSTWTHAQTDYYFLRSDSVVVRFNADTNELAWAGGLNYAQFSNIDLNFDGKQDLFVFDRTGNRHLCFLYDGPTGSTKYRYAWQYESAFPAMSNWALLYDYNCDNLPDIFTYTPGGIRVYRNTSTAGNLSFVLQVDLIKSNQLGNFVNLYVSSVDLPGLEDIDEDGDLDILTFGVFGTSIEYHRNYSVENGNGCDSLQFNLLNQCWGCFHESVVSNSVSLYDTCDNTGIPNPELALLIAEATQNDIQNNQRSVSRHSGSCTCVFDEDGDGHKELLMGDVSFPSLVEVKNGATAFNQNQCMTDQDSTFPSYSTPVDLELFPCAFMVDVNNDGKRDMVATPQTTGSAENKWSAHYYYNSNSEAVPVFNFVREDLLQSEMIERGEGTVPVLADYNNDGLKDMFVANFGIYNSTTDTYVSTISLYVNVGTATQPQFNLLTENFESMDVVLGKRGMIPTFGDLDGDGDDDMLVGDENGNIAFFSNTAGATANYDFVLTNPLLQDDQATTIDVGQYAAPLLVDLDRDGDLDLVIGCKTGKMVYYENMGSSSSFIFRFRTNFLGNVTVTEWWDNSGYSIPSVYDDNGAYQFMVGSKSGWIHHFNDVEGHINGNFARVDTTVLPSLEIIRSAPVFAELNGDGKPDLIIGNYRGGLQLYMGNPDSAASVNQLENISFFQIFPNPAQSTLIVESSIFGNQVMLYLHNMIGEEVMVVNLRTGWEYLDVAYLPAGIYFVTISNGKIKQTIKLVKHD